MKHILIYTVIAGFLLAAISFAEIRGHQEPGILYTGLSTDNKATISPAPKPGDRFIETDKGIYFIYTGSAWVNLVISAVSDTSTMTAPGNFKPVCVTGYSIITFAFTDSLVATSVTIQFQGKIAGISPIDWANLDADSDSLVLVGANGTWYRTYNFASTIDSVRIKVVSEAGGVAGKFWSAIKMANPFK